MVFARLFFGAALCFVWPQSSTAQSSVSGRYVVEPVIGRLFSGNAEPLTVFGARGTWRRSYSKSVFATAIYGRDTRSEHIDPYNSAATSISRRHVIASVGVGSTIVDRDATGSYGIHLLLGLGAASYHVQGRSTFQAPNQVAERHEFGHLESGPIADLALVGELELFSPRILARAQAGAYVGLNVTRQEYEGFLWFPGASITVGIAAAF